MMLAEMNNNGLAIGLVHKQLNLDKNPDTGKPVSGKLAEKIEYEKIIVNWFLEHARIS